MLKKFLKTLVHQKSFYNKHRCNIELPKNKILELIQSEWLVNINSKPNLRTYVKLKSVPIQIEKISPDSVKNWCVTSKNWN